MTEITKEHRKDRPSCGWWHGCHFRLTWTCFRPHHRGCSCRAFLRRVCYCCLRRYDKGYLCFFLTPAVLLLVVTEQTTIFPFTRAGFKEPLSHVLAESMLFGSITTSTPKMSGILPSPLVLVFKDSPWITFMPLPSTTSTAKILFVVLTSTVIT